MNEIKLSVLESLRAENAGLKIEPVYSPAFCAFGRVLPFSPFAEIAVRAAQTPVPSDGNRYVADDAALYSPEEKAFLETSFFGGVSLQIGWCNGNGSRMNALEYHKSSEINIAVSDLVLILGRVCDITENCFNSSRAETFFVPAGAAVELYATTLHFAPCRADKNGFRTVVILPSGTNGELTVHEKETAKQSGFSESALIFARNKWLLAHPGAKHLLSRGAVAAICGENLEIRPI